MTDDAIARLLQNLIALERIANTITREAEVRIQALYRAIVEDLRLIDPGGPVQPTYRRGRTDEFLKQVAARLREFSTAEQSALKDRLAVVGRVQGKQAEVALKATLGSKAARVRITPITQQRMRAILNTDPFQGRLLSEHVKQISANAYVRVRDQVRLGMLNEEAIPDMVRRIRGTQVGNRFVGGVLTSTTREAEALVRTAVTHISSEGMRQTFAENKSILAGVRYAAVLDSRTTVLCFPGSTVVRWFGALQNVFRSQYRGDVVVITTASGKELEGTPNHPVLTTNGFLPVGEINPGEHVVYSMPFHGREVGDDKDVGVPATLAQLYDSFNKPSRSRVLRKRAAPADFYGDGMGMNGEIDVLVPHRHLRHGDQAVLAEKSMNVTLGRIHASSVFNAGGSSDALFFGWRPLAEAPELALVSAEDGPDPLWRAPTDESHNVRGSFAGIEKRHGTRGIFSETDVCLPSPQGRHDAGFFEEGSHGRCGDAVIARELRCTGAGSVRPDHVVSARREFRDCHVYTLCTGPGIYIAGGMVVQNCASLDGTVWPADSDEIVVPGRDTHLNCRSALVPEVDWAKLGVTSPPEPVRSARDESGLSEEALNRRVSARRRRGELGEVVRVPSSVTAAAWLRRQPVRVQEKMLGVGKAKLFRDGKISLSDLVRQDNSIVSLDELVGAS